MRGGGEVVRPAFPREFVHAMNLNPGAYRKRYLISECAFGIWINVKASRA